MMKNSILEKLPINFPSVHCIGIGGVGVSAIAELLLDCNCKVTGSDTEFNSVCQYLTTRGAVIAPAGHREENLPAGECGGVIMTAAASLDNPEAVAMLRRGVMLWKRGEFLGELCRAYERPVMIAGSHGKSSTTAMLNWILTQCGKNPGLLLGAHYNGSMRNAAAGNGDILVAEADESDGTVGLLSGELALITNVDGDHAWNDTEKRAQYAAFQQFARSFRKTIYPADAPGSELFDKMDNCQALSKEKIAEYDRMLPDTFLGYERKNAVLALAAAEYLQIDLKSAAAALQSYPGIQRRQNELYCSPDKTVVVAEDYAHHPTELAASLEVLLQRYPGRQLDIFFQPHRYQRLRHYFHEFTTILSDKKLRCWILPVFSAWENAPIDALENSDLAAAINRAGGDAKAVNGDFCSQAGVLVKTVLENSQQHLIALIGAGDICYLAPELIKALQAESKKAREIL